MKCYCEDTNLELRGCKGPRWPTDSTRYTYHLCYRCGHVWVDKETPKQIRRTNGFRVYKIVDGVMGFETEAILYNRV